jgi:hypothetical protein
MTIEDFEKLPDELAINHELVDGKLVEVSGNSGNQNAPRDWLGGTAAAARGPEQAGQSPRGAGVRFSR